MTFGITFDWLVLAFIILIFYWTQTSITRARKGKKVYIRRIPGISAIEEAVGRAAEMGKPIVYSPGISSEREVPTYASLAILSYVARLVAKLGLRLIVTIVKPTVYPMAESTVKEAYRQQGKIDDFVEEDIRFLSDNTAIYAMMTANIIEQEQAACAFFLGQFDYTSLLMTEPGSRSGAIQIAGDVGLWQIPFLIASCDYTIIGEEVYAASAYCSDSPAIKGSVRAQDRIKLLLVMLMVIGVVLNSLPWWSWLADSWFVQMFMRYQ